MPRRLLGIETDLGWRKVLGYMRRAGEASKLKRKVRRRERREGKAEVAQNWRETNLNRHKPWRDLNAPAEQENDRDGDQGDGLD